MITWESRHRVMYKAARASVTDTSIEVRRSTTAATAPTKPTTSLTSSNIKEDILTQPRRRSADISNRKIKYIMKEMPDIVCRELHYEAEPFEMSAGKKVNTREQPETNFICLSCYIEEHL